MTQITTSGGLITFQDTATGLTKQIGQNRLWLMFKAETVNFLQVDVPTDGYDGTPFWTCRASNMTINGQTYTIEQLKNGEGLDGLFSSMSFNIEIVDELPSVGDPSTIYLIYDDETGTYTEYLWLSQEQVYEELGSVADVDLGNYYTKTQVDQLLAVKANLSALATVATSGSYNDLSDKPVIPTVPTNVSAFTNDAGYLTEHQSLDNYYNKTQTDNLLAAKQNTLVSGTNIKTINNQSLLGEGNITIEGGGGGTQVQSNWNETDTSSMAYIQNKPTNVSSFVNDANYLTQHQSLADVFADVVYDSSTKRINFYGKGDTQHTTVIGYVDASSFVVDGMVEDVRIENGNLVIDFNTDSGITDITIPLTDIFDPSNYYTAEDIDDMLEGYVGQGDLAQVAFTGDYTDLLNKPVIPAGVTVDQTLNTSSTNAIANSAVATALNSKADSSALSDYATTTAMNTALAGKQDTLTAGTNITIATDQQTGNLVISASGGGTGTVTGVSMNGGSAISPDANGVVDLGTVITAHQTVDTVLSASSNNPIANSTVYAVVGQIEQALIAINGSSQS